MTPRPKYKKLYLIEKAKLDYIQKNHYDVSSQVNGDETCSHKFPKFGKLESWGGGFVHSTFICELCGFEVSQFLGEQCPPELIPSKEVCGQIRSWDE